MNVNYFGYTLKNTDTFERHFHSIKPLIENYCSKSTADFQKTFTFNDESLFLFHVYGNVYMFIMTRTEDVLRMINTSDLTVEDLTKALNKDGKRLGCASYILIEDNYLGFASSLYAPKHDIFVHYINELLTAIGIQNWSLDLVAFTHKANRNDIKQMSFIGRSSFNLSKSNGLVQNLLKDIGCNPEDIIDLEGIEIIVKPKRGKPVNSIVTNFIDNIPQDGCNRMIIKAKNEVSGALSSLYLAESGAIMDEVNKANTDLSIAQAMESKAFSNSILQNQIKEFMDYENISVLPIKTIIDFINADSWTITVPSLQPTD